MPVSKETKAQQIEMLHELFEHSKAVVVLDYRGLTAAQMGQLRNRLRPFDGRIVVAKNTLVKRSLSELSMPTPDELLQGPSAFSFCLGEIADTVGAIAGFARENDALTVKGAIVGESVLDSVAATALKDIPSAEVLRSQIVGGLQSPLASVVGVFSTALQGILYAMRARVEQLEAAG